MLKKSSRIAKSSRNDAIATMEEEEEEDGVEITRGVSECPVCFQPYEDSLIVPRVLSCGHSLCDCCISSLSIPLDPGDGTRSRPSFLRCPECNQRTKLQGIPKNIELLRFIRTLNTKSQQSAAASHGGGRQPDLHGGGQIHVTPIFPRRRPFLIYETSITELCGWILPQNSAQITQHPSLGQVFVCHGSDDMKQMVFPATFISIEALWLTRSGIDYGQKIQGMDYRQKVRSRLELLTGHQCKDLLYFLQAQDGVCGIWMDVAGNLYVVYKVLANQEQLATLQEGRGTQNSMSYFFWRAMELCEIFIRLHKLHVIMGLVVPSCLGDTDFLHIRLDVGRLFNLRNSFLSCVKSGEVASSGKLANANLLETLPFYYGSPEFLAGITESSSLSRSIIGCRSDSWSLGCLLCSLLFGRTPWDGLSLAKYFEKSVHAIEHTKPWIEDHVNADTIYQPLCNEDLFARFIAVLVSCFSYRPHERPCISEVWNLLHCMQALPKNGAVSSEARDPTMCCYVGLKSTETIWCLSLGCYVHGTKEEKANQTKDCSRSCVGASGKAFKGLCQDEKPEVEEVQSSSSLEGHSGYITCLAVCGRHLLSASSDKTICVWSIRDSTLVKSLKGHSYKVMALASDEHLSLCISGDYGGELCAWDVESTAVDCIKKWHHHQDWRYSGVGSLAVSADGLLYSGAGDRTIKVWSLESYDLVTTMEGHKALVSALLVNEDVLYSGSWDGMVRLWWRSDHSPLVVLSESSQHGAVLAFVNPAGLLVAGYQSGRLQVWKDEACLNSFSAHDGLISTLCLYGNKFYSGSWDGSIKAWEVDVLLDDPTSVVEVKCESPVKALACLDGKIFVGLTSNTISVFPIRCS